MDKKINKSKRLNIPHDRLRGYNQEFETNVLPDLINDERERKTRVRLGFIIAAILTPPSVWLAWYLGFASDDPDSRAISLAFIIPYMGYLSVVWALMRRTKHRLVKSMSGFLKWTHSENEDQSTLVNRLCFFGLLPKHKTIRVGDVLKGRHENWPFEMCEITLQKIEGWGRNRRVVTVFQGIVLSFRLGHISPAVTVLTRDGSLGHPQVPQVLNHEGYYEDTLGDVIVRSSDLTSLNTVMCQRFRAGIEELSQSMSHMSVSCLVDKYFLHIPLKSKDRFEMDLMFESMEDSRRVQKILNEFSEVLKMLDIVLKRRACKDTGEMSYSNFRI